MLHLSRKSVGKCVEHVISEEDVYKTRLVPDLIVTVDHEFSDESDAYVDHCLASRTPF